MCIRQPLSLAKRLITTSLMFKKKKKMTEALTARASIQREGVNLIISFKSFLRPEAAAAAKASDGMNLQSVLSKQAGRRLRFSKERPRAALNGDPLQVPTGSRRRHLGLGPV